MRPQVAVNVPNVAQSGILLCRGLVIRRAGISATVKNLTYLAPAECHSAKQQINTLRYNRPPL
jgi:hypothetical protein